MKAFLDEITATRFYWRAYGVITGRSGHASRGPQWTFWRGLRAIAGSMQRLHRGELKSYTPPTKKHPVDTADLTRNGGQDA